jgi:hypothetical protein
MKRNFPRKPSIAQKCPEDILFIIFSHFDHRSRTTSADRARLRLVCSDWNNVATPLLYHSVEPQSRISLEQLVQAVCSSPHLGGLIRELRFPQFHRKHRHGYFSQFRFHRDRFCHTPVYREPVSEGTVGVAVLDYLARLYLSVVERCLNLESLDIPLYHMGKWKIDRSKLDGVTTLILHGEGDWSGRPWLRQDITRFLSEVVYQLPNLHALHLSLFNEQSCTPAIFPPITPNHFPKLNYVSTNCNPAGLYIVSTMLIACGDRLERLVVHGGSKCLDVADQVGNAMLCKRVEIVDLATFWDVDCTRPCFARVTDLFLGIIDFSAMDIWEDSFDRLPPNMESFSLSVRLGRDHSTPFEYGRLLRDLRLSLVKYRRMSTFKVTWPASVSECQDWAIMAFCLHEFYRKKGIHMSIQLQLSKLFVQKD